MGSCKAFAKFPEFRTESIRCNKLCLLKIDSEEDAGKVISVGNADYQRRKNAPLCMLVECDSDILALRGVRKIK